MNHGPSVRFPPAVPILLVDDNAAHLAALEAVLTSLGQQLVTATSGESAIAKARDTEFASILLDVRMPNLDGLQTAALIRAHTTNRRTPIIFLTAEETE